MCDKNPSFVDDLLLKGLLLVNSDIADIDISPCIADPDRIKYMAKINRNLSDILPTLYLSLPNSRLTKNLPILSFTVKQHNFMLDEKGNFAVTYVKDEAEVSYINEKIIELINKGIKYNISTHINLDQMIEKKRKLTPMTLYESFPKTNCRECGEESCFNYVAKIMSGENSHDMCPHTDPKIIGDVIKPIDLKWNIL
jgi:ArsR family metal-binding transcriptional regulator